jgi:hypothetical protein
MVSLYGSFASKVNFGEASDLDWIIIFESIEAMFDSIEFAEVQCLLREAHIPFTSPVISIPDIENEKHLIGPLIYGIRQTVNRIIIARDPVELFDEYGYNNIAILSHMFASYPRYFFELVVSQYRLCQKNEEILSALLQMSVDYTVDTCRSMVAIRAEAEDRVFDLTFDNYRALYQKDIKEEDMVIGNSIFEFLSEYKKWLSEVIAVLKKGSDKEREGIIQEYANFLGRNKDLIIKSIHFCRANIDYFKNMY